MIDVFGEDAPTTLIREPRRENSRKPEAFYRLVGRVTPAARYASIFSQGGEGELWDSHGDQVGKYAPGAAPAEGRAGRREADGAGPHRAGRHRHDELRHGALPRRRHQRTARHIAGKALRARALQAGREAQSQDGQAQGRLLDQRLGRHQRPDHR
ncbi:MAG: hypothetical protein M5U08_13835 [Burkholderiales bacterium]|nr:hypothetical protein [Burkholderiales bacterium]